MDGLGGLIQSRFARCVLAGGLVAFVIGLVGCAGYTAGSSSTNQPGSGSPSSQGPAISAVASGPLASTSAVITWTTSVGSTSQVSYGTTAAYGQSTAVNTNMVSTHSVTLSGLTASTTYHFQVLSQDANSYQSASGDSTFTTTAGSTPLTISAVAASSIASTSATITWVTSTGGTSQVNYGTTVSYGQNSTLNSSMLTSHSVALSGLTASTTYHYRVVSVDAQNNQATSSDATFTTSVSGVPPTISGVTVSGIASTGGIVTWTTNVGATSQVNYGTTASYGQNSTLNSSLVTSHSVALSGLMVSTTYHYRVVSKDTNGNQATSGDSTFTTSAPPPDTQAPTVPTNLAAGALSSSQINLTWTVSSDNVAVTGYDVYRNGSKVGTSASASYIDTGLSASTMYSYNIDAFDAAGNKSAQTSSVSASTPAQSGGGSGGFLPQGQGWHDMGASTRLQISQDSNPNPAICPADNFQSSGYGFSADCANVYFAWNSGAPDDDDEMLLMCAHGGHADYQGNECYGLKYGQSTPALVRLNNPTLPISVNGYGYIPDNGAASTNCVSTTQINSVPICPNARHTYDGEVYIPSTKQLMLEGGAVGPVGPMRSIDNWLLNVSTMTWTRIDTCGQGLVGDSCGGQTRPGSAGEPVDLSSMAYDSSTGNVYFLNLYNNDLWQYTPTTLLWTKLAGGVLPGGYAEYVVSAVDPVNHKLMVINAQSSGQIVTSVSLNSPYTATDQTSKCSSASKFTPSGTGTAPAITYDTALQQFIVIPVNLGNTVYELNPTTFACTALTFSVAAGNSSINGPADPTNGGVNSALILGKRAFYSPKEDAIIISGGPYQDAYFLRLSQTTNTSAALADFTARCTAPGVVLCQGFDDSTGFQTNVNIFANSSYPTVFPSKDTAVSRSGGSSLRIDVPPFQGSNMGKFDTAFSGFTGANGEDFYFQVATRISPEMLSNYINFNWPTWKNHGFFNGNTSCTGLMVVTGLNNDGIIPTATTGGCSANAFYTNNGTPPYLMQQGDYNCPYAGETPLLCFEWPTNTWITFYYHIKLGTLNSNGDFPNTTAEAYVSVNGQPYKQFVNFQGNYYFAGNGPNAPFNHLELYPYMTGKDDTQGGYPTAHVWYDELIVSKQPIPAPAVPPATP